MTTVVNNPQIVPRPPALRAADQGVASALTSVLPENTRRVYGAQWRLFHEWCDSVGLPSLPAQPLTVARYLAVAETDASGNCINAWRVPLVTYGKNTNQAEALIGDAVASVVRVRPRSRQAHRHREAGLPAEEGCRWRGSPVKYSRMLSSFSYGKIKAYFISRGYREGVEIHQVNPAFSSDSRPGEVHGAVRADGTPGSGPWCWPVACSAVRSASRAGGFVPSAMACMSPSPYP